MVKGSKNGLHAKRYREILHVLIKNGLGFLFVKSALSRNPQKELAKEDQAPGMGAVAERIRVSCEELGPTFVKLGQILSTRTDIIPEDVALELQKLQDDVAPFPYQEARALVEEELGGPIDSIFADFDCEPVASASVSQVYRATLFSGGCVAVKVQRPGVIPNIETDLHILLQLARFVDKRTKYGKLYDFEGMVLELKKVMEQEMNFQHEGENIDRFRENMAGQLDITVPRVRWMYTTRKVLTMDYVDGVKINDVAALDALGADKAKIARLFAESLLRQILVDGFFHADPHPGNVMVTDGGAKIEFIDLGMAGTLGERFRRQLTDMLLGVATQNTTKIAQAIMEMDVAASNVNQYKFTRSLDILLDQYLYVPLGKVNIANVFSSVFQLAGDYKMRIPREFALVAKSLGTAQSVIEELSPKTSVLEIAEGTVTRLVTGQFSAKKLKNAAFAAAADTADIARELPAYLLTFMRKTAENDFAVEARIKNMEKLQQGLERMANRISFTVVLLAVCIVMAGVVVAIGLQARASVELFDLSLFALRAGLAIAVVIVFGIVLNIIYTNVKKK